MRISELMSQPPFTCSEHDMAHSAAHQMWEQDVGAIAITDDHGRVSGVVTDRDLCMAAFTQDKRLGEIPVGAVMTERPACCGPDDTVETAERIMAENQIRRLPIVDSDRRPVGFLSMNDITRGAAAGRTDGVDAGEVVRSLSAIGKPRRGHPAHPSAA